MTLKFKELNDSNLFLYAAKHYRNPNFVDVEEFQEDLKRFKYIKILTNRYLKSDKLAERLILNHLIVIFNSFGIEASLNMLDFKLDKKHWPVIKPFLVFLKYITNDQYTGIEMDKKVIERLRSI
tara:strand:- start:2036 stop:2407 length:372 start_codon:yes stop_codon:yes gene_type:complete